VPARLRRIIQDCLQSANGTRKRWLPTGLTALRADGEEIPIEGTLSPVRFNDRVEYTLILRDLQERATVPGSAGPLQSLSARPGKSARDGQAFAGVIGEAPAMQAVFEAVRLVARTDATVLITGETGTGKELIARAVHDAGERRSRPLVNINCAALPGELIESELFGHERGAFTGATIQRRGRFELADNGTIFLDEVGELSAQAQAKLLRVLQEQVFERVGGGQAIKIDVRVIAATNCDLAQMVKAGTFRADLFYRLNVFPLVVPALRDRRSDIPLLARYFLARYARKLDKSLQDIDPISMQRLSTYHWPGNVRELQNVIERMTIMAVGPTLEIDETLLESSEVDAAAPSTDQLDEVSRNHIERVLKDCRGTIEGTKGAATVLGLKPSTLRYRMKLLGIERPAGAL
jgi:transcriptional regulator with GAF, ATPase, and Fis domain